MREALRRHMSLPSFALVALALFVVASGSATAASLLTSKNIKDESIQNRDLRDGAFTLSKLRKSTQGVLTADTDSTLARLDALEKKAGIPGPAGAAGAAGANGTNGTAGANGTAGTNGTNGTAGAKGDKGDIGPGSTSGNWGIINRNTIGSPTATLRSGPFASFGATAGVNPPIGKGSLNLNVGRVPSAEAGFDKRERISYGNEVDYQGKDLATTFGSTVGYSYFTTNENGATNLPGLNFEINPNLATNASTFATMVYVPPSATQIGRWSDFVDATNVGTWYLSGSVGTAIGCSQGNPCSFTNIMANLNDGGAKSTLYTVAVIKGRDDAFQGAVDNLKFGTTTVDFEENGVFVTPAP